MSAMGSQTTSLTIVYSTLESQITSFTIVYSTVYSGADQRKHQSYASLAVVMGIHRWPVTGEFTAQRANNAENVPFDEVIMDDHSDGRCYGAKECQVAPCWFQRHLSIKFLALSLLSGVPDLWDRNKILSGGDLSHYQGPHCIRVFFYFVCFVFIHHNFQFYFALCTYCNILDIYLS